MIDIRQGSYRNVLDDVNANLILTSPPYNIGSKGPRQDGNRKNGLYDAKSFRSITDYPDSLPESEYQDQQAAFLVWCADHLVLNGTVVYNHKPRRNGKMIHPAEWFLRPEVRERLTLMEEITWDRGSTHNHGKTLAWPQTERLYVFRRTDGAYSMRNDTVDLPQRSDVWRIPPEKAGGHNAPFPIPLADAVIRLWSQSVDLVCDPYSGSGTTAVAAQRLNRGFVGSEILAKYVRMSRTRVAADQKMRKAA